MAEGKRKASDSRRVDLQAVEAELLLKALRKYRYSLPVYLKVVQPELQLVDRLIKKLS